MDSSVGDDRYRDTIKTGNWSLLFRNGQGWDYEPFKHVGSTTLLTSADGTTGYIPIGINITFPRQDAEYINYFVKRASLTINTPTTPVSSTTSGPSGTALPANGSGSGKISVGAFIGTIFAVVILVVLVIVGVLCFLRRRRQRRGDGGGGGGGGGRSATLMGELGSLPQRDTTIGRNPLIPQPYPTPGSNNGFMDQGDTRYQIPTPTTYNTNGNNTRSSAAPLINIGSGESGSGSNQNLLAGAGGLAGVGAGAGVGAAAVGGGIPADQSSSSAGGAGGRRLSTAYTAYTNDYPPAYIGPNSPQPSQYHASTTIARSSHEHLSSVSGGGGQALAQFAQENRSLITEELEMKLQRAGYVPTDDPDSIPEEEWKRDYGVTKFELARLRSLFR
ncbi:hypothetical protein FRC17_009645, partial [Serendipita sp. 399]